MEIFKREIFVFSFKRFFVKHFYADITLRIHFYYSIFFKILRTNKITKKRHPDFTRSAVINFDYRIRIVLSVEYSALFSVSRISADLTVDTCKSACAAYINSHVSLSKFRNCKCTVSNILNITCNSVNILAVRNVLECCT